MSWNVFFIVLTVLFGKFICISKYFHLLLIPNLHHFHWCISFLLSIDWFVHTVEWTLPESQPGIHLPLFHPYTGCPNLLPAPVYHPCPGQDMAAQTRVHRPILSQSPPACPELPPTYLSSGQGALLPPGVLSSAGPGVHVFTVFFYTCQVFFFVLLCFFPDRIRVILYTGSNAGF